MSCCPSAGPDSAIVASSEPSAYTGIAGSARAFGFHLLCMRSVFRPAPLAPNAAASHVRCAAPNVVEYSDMFRMRTGSMLYACCESTELDIHASNPRMLVSRRSHAHVGWYPTGCCASGAM